MNVIPYNRAFESIVFVILSLSTQTQKAWRMLVWNPAWSVGAPAIWVWIPKSVCRILSEPVVNAFGRESCGEVAVPQWLALKWESSITCNTEKELANLATLYRDSYQAVLDSISEINLLDTVLKKRDALVNNFIEQVSPFFCASSCFKNQCETCEAWAREFRRWMERITPDTAVRLLKSLPQDFKASSDNPASQRTFFRDLFLRTIPFGTAKAPGFMQGYSQQYWEKLCYYDEATEMNDSINTILGETELLLRDLLGNRLYPLYANEFILQLRKMNLAALRPIQKKLAARELSPSAFFNSTYSMQWIASKQGDAFWLTIWKAL